MEKISLPHDAIQCHDPVCSNASHKSEIKDFYDAITNVLLTESTPLKNNFKSQRSGLHVPGWNSDVKHAHSIARQNYLKWIDNGKPRSGNLYQQMRNSRKIFKSKLRACKNMSEQRRADALATALQIDKSTKLFWQKVKRTKKSSPLPILVDNATGTIDVADHWRSRYESILQSGTKV